MYLEINELGKDDPNLETALNICMFKIPVDLSSPKDIYLLTDYNNPFGISNILKNHYEDALEELDIYNKRYLPRGERKVPSEIFPIYSEVSDHDNLAATCMMFKSDDSNQDLDNGKYILQMSDIDCQFKEIFTMNMFFDSNMKYNKDNFFLIKHNNSLKGPIHNSIRMNIERGLTSVHKKKFKGEPFLIANIQDLLAEVGITSPIPFRYLGYKN